MSKTSKTLGQCILDCQNDNSCETDCVSAFKDEHSECPCQVCVTDPYDCKNDFNIICVCLTLFSEKLLFLGGVTENFEFKINDDTEVKQSCSATLNGEVFVFGGISTSNNRRKQVSVNQQRI